MLKDGANVCKCMKATVIWGGVFDAKINNKQANLLKNEANVCKCMKDPVIWGGVFDAKINNTKNSKSVETRSTCM